MSKLIEETNKNAVWHGTPINYTDETIKNNPFSKDLEKVSKLMDMGQLTKAEKIIDSILKKDPDNHSALHYLGAIAYAGRHVESAYSLVERAIELDPENFVYYLSMAELLIKEEKFSESLKYLFKAGDLKPDNIPIKLKIGKVLLETREYKSIIPLMFEVLNKDQSVIKAYNLMGVAWHYLNNFDNAILCYEEALSIDPNNVSILTNYADTLEVVGKIDEAKASLRKALSFDKKSVAIYYLLADLGELSDDEEAYRFLENAKNSPKYDMQEKAMAFCALGRMYHNAQNYEEALKNWVGNHTLRDSKGIKYDRDNMREFSNNFMKTFNKDFFEKNKNWGIDTKKPIFIVGMPRSGTSLVEQILASHPQVFGGGELEKLGEVRNYIFDLNNLSKTVTKNAVKIAAEEYLAYINELSGNANFVTDKMPYNFFNVWLIYLMFPNAKIIWCRREPIATCFSCYTQNFALKHEFTHDLSNLGQFYNEHTRLMKHWEEVIPTNILEMQYESLVENTEENIKKLLDYCELDWNDECSRFYKTDRVVNTASRSQVRKKIYKDSIAKWTPYKEFLKPLIDELENK